MPTREAMMEHTEAHLEAYLPIKAKDFADWMLVHMGIPISNPAAPGMQVYNFLVLDLVSFLSTISQTVCLDIVS